ncbi:MAG: CpXC domain-containing protein [Balneolaceae bacterium]|nr:CpXC domain-containing protein [Balneolaceae bacterium]
MTVALCPDCGSLKNGVLLPCVDCGHEPANDIGMPFSSHYLSKTTLEEFSDLFKKLRKEASNEDVAAWTFFYIINEFYPEITYLKIPKDFQQAATALIKRIELENVIVEDSPTAFTSDGVEGKYTTKVRHYIKRCPECNSLKSIAAWHVINGSMDPGYIPFVLNLRIFHSKCMVCGHREELSYEAVYYEFDERQFAISKKVRHRFAVSNREGS